MTAKNGWRIGRGMRACCRPLEDRNPDGVEPHRAGAVLQAENNLSIAGVGGNPHGEPEFSPIECAKHVVLVLPAGPRLLGLVVQHELDAKIGCRRFAHIVGFGHAFEQELAAAVAGQIERQANQVCSQGLIGWHADAKGSCSLIPPVPFCKTTQLPGVMPGWHVEVALEDHVAWLRQIAALRAECGRYDNEDRTYQCFHLLINQHRLSPGAELGQG